MTDDEAFDAMITENFQRKDVDPIEEAYAFGQLIEKGNTAEETILAQYKEMKKKHSDALLLFRVGNNYVALHEDAAAAFAETLTGLEEKRIKGEKVQVCRFPADGLDTILPKLIKAGYRVAICESQE